MSHAQDWSQPQQAGPQGYYQPTFSPPQYQVQPMYSPQQHQQPYHEQSGFSFPSYQAQPMYSAQPYQEQPAFSPPSYRIHPIHSPQPQQAKVEQELPVTHIAEPQPAQTPDIESKPRRPQEQNPSQTQGSLGSGYNETQLFTIKVFAIVTVQALLVVGLTGITYIPNLGIKEFISDKVAITVIALVILLVLAGVLYYAKNSLKEPWTYVLMALSTIATAYVFAALGSSSESGNLAPLCIVGYTLAVMISNTLYAFYREADYVKNYIHPIAVGLIVTLGLAVILFFALRDRVGECLPSALVGVGYGIALPIMMAALVEKHQKDQHIIASVKLFVFIAIFWILLLAYAGSQSKRQERRRPAFQVGISGGGRAGWFGFY